MQALRKLLYKIGGPDSKHPLALFHHCDIAVMHQMNQLGQLMKTSPNNLDRRSQLIQQLKDAQHNLINVFNHLVETTIPDLQSSTEFRVKYSDDVQSNLLFGTIWFGAECLTAGSQIVNHERDSLELRPYALRLSKAISSLRQALREESHQYYYNEPFFTERVKELLMLYDRCWVEFEFRYVSVMYSVRTETQYLHQQELAVLFSEATNRALKMKYFAQDMLEAMDPMVMFAIPRLAIVCGLAINSDGPINPHRSSNDIPKCFKEYNQLLKRIQELMTVLNEEQIIALERALCTSDGCSLYTNDSTDITSSTNNNSADTNEITTGSEVPLPIVHTVSHDDEGLPNDEEDTSCKDNQQTEEEQISSHPICTPSVSTLLSDNKSKPDLLQRLFLVISGVADQLQTNFPKDFRAILKQSYTFSLSQPDGFPGCDGKKIRRQNRFDVPSDCLTFDLSLTSLMTAPAQISHHWMADSDSPNCHRCSESFSLFRRRHHCRTCGEVVCGQCSSHFLPQLQDEEETLLRVCNTCYIRELGRITQTLSTGSHTTAVEVQREHPHIAPHVTLTSYN